MELPVLEQRRKINTRKTISFAISFKKKILFLDPSGKKLRYTAIVFQNVI